MQIAFREKFAVLGSNDRPAMLSGVQGVLCRAVALVLLVAICHQLRWEWLCGVTSEAVLRMSTALGLSALRLSTDTIVVQGQAVRYVTSCTFIDVLAGVIALLWNVRVSLSANATRLLVAAALLFGFNLARLETAQLVYAAGASWDAADGVVGGIAYFLVWLAIWPRCSWATPGTLAANS
jgi:exosortase/archaeosortase